MKKALLILSLLNCLFISCKKKTDTLFVGHSSNETNVRFVNKLTPNDSINPFTFTNFYNGGGVGIGDLNGDGKPDIFLGGNQVSSKLYLSKIDTLSGKWEFEDVTEKARLTTTRWCTGISMVDINQDGLLDIYVSVAKHIKMPDSENMLFINQGNDPDGVPLFEDQAKRYGLNDHAFTTQTAFFDADLDGDLDAFLMNTAPDLQNPNFIRQTYHDGSYPSTGRFYINDGPDENGVPQYRNISREAGVKFEGLGLGLAISDLNKDGYPDIYCSNDFISSDILYLNSGSANPAFENVIKRSTAHTSLFGMGLDIADINNDTYPDIFQLDMLPEDNLRQKKMLAGQDYDRKEMSISEQYGYQLQYMRNMLQLNLGQLSHTHNLPLFSEIGLVAGISKTDWSWAPLIADYDNDGLKDIFITNGYRRDVTDRDFIQFKEDFSNFGTTSFKQQNALELMQKVPEVKIANYAYKNAGDLTFENTSKTWGLDELSYSNGAAYADLDGDGDLDLVVNNIDSEAFIYQNESQKQTGAHYISIALKGNKGNLAGIGSTITIWHKNQTQYAEMYVARGFLSSVGTGIHFGLGESHVIDSMQVTWPGGTSQKLYQIKANQQLILDQKNAKTAQQPREETEPEPYFTDISDEIKLDFLHEKSTFIDFKQTAALHKMLSKGGFPIAVGDADRDGLDDFFVGASYKTGKPCIYFQQRSGAFSKRVVTSDSLHENISATFFDADGDKDLDLIVVNGGNERPETDHSFYEVQLYVNDGHGNFTRSASALPSLSVSGSCVVSNDFDKDGDVDLFIGGRMIPGKYPLPARSYLLRNDSKSGKIQFTDVTQTYCPELLTAGMVCAAVWADTDQDGLEDLVIAGEWMPLRVFQNQKGKFRETETSKASFSPYSGWWNSLAAADFDRDGDIDFIAGNEGMNTYYRASHTEPAKMIAKDFNGDGTFDPFMGYYIQGTSYPSVPRDALNQQVIQFRRKYPHYIDYAKATFDDLLTPDERKDAYTTQATYLKSAYIENLGDGKFRVSALPVEAQFAPVFGIVVTDINADQNPDVILTGNFFPNEVNMGRQDASIGLLLLGNGKGSFSSQTPQKSGLLIQGDARGSAILRNSKNEKVLLTAIHAMGVKFNRLNVKKPELVLKGK